MPPKADKPAAEKKSKAKPAAEKKEVAEKKEATGEKKVKYFYWSFYSSIYENCLVLSKF